MRTIRYKNAKRRLVKIFLFIMLCAIPLNCKESPPGNSHRPLSKKPIIGFSLGTQREQRWIRDRDWFIEKANELGARVNVFFANNNSELQFSQSENLILQGIDVLVIVPQNSQTGSQIVQKAHASGIKVLAYDRMINNCDLDFYVSFDNERVGELQAQGILERMPQGALAYIGGSETDYNAHLLKKGTMERLQPHLQNGTIQLVIDTFTPDWKPEEAYRSIKSYLSHQGNLDAVICANDGTAFGVIQALKEYALDGKVPVSGQDAELSACHRIINGSQSFTVYKPIRKLAYKAAAIAVAFATNRPVTANRSVENGHKQVPSYLLEPVLVDKNNMDKTIIADGFYTATEIYKRN